MTASVVPGVELQSFTIHSQMTMVYLPGPLNESNDQWLELSWQEGPSSTRSTSTFVATIRCGTARPPPAPDRGGRLGGNRRVPARRRMAPCPRFKLDTPIVARAIRIVNLFEIAGLEVRNSAIEK